MNLELYRPAVHDLWFTRDLLADEATMSYNRAWGGTVDFPEDLWGRWHDALVAREGEGRRFYRYPLARRVGRARGRGAALLPLPARPRRR